jgi:hypothetical protein
MDVDHLIATGSLAERLNADPEFRLSAATWTASLAWYVADGGRYRLNVADGVVTHFGVDAGCADPATVRMHFSRRDWLQLFEPVPKPLSELWSVLRSGEATLEGDLVESFFPYYPALSRAIAVVRAALHAMPAQAAPPRVTRQFDAAVGRYVYVDIQGVQYRVYYEESGAVDGVPLIMLHTAGADGRQWRHVLEDAELRSAFRMVAPDLPYHGKSLPPEQSIPGSTFRLLEGAGHFAMSENPTGFVEVIRPLLHENARTVPI